MWTLGSSKRQRPDSRLIPFCQKMSWGADAIRHFGVLSAFSTRRPSFASSTMQAAVQNFCRAISPCGLPFQRPCLRVRIEKVFSQSMALIAAETASASLAKLGVGKGASDVRAGLHLGLHLFDCIALARQASGFSPIVEIISCIVSVPTCGQVTPPFSVLDFCTRRNTNCAWARQCASAT